MMDQGGASIEVNSRGPARHGWADSRLVRTERNGGDRDAGGTRSVLNEVFSMSLFQLRIANRYFSGFREEHAEGPTCVPWCDTLVPFRGNPMHYYTGKVSYIEARTTTC